MKSSSFFLLCLVSLFIITGACIPSQPVPQNTTPEDTSISEPPTQSPPVQTDSSTSGNKSVDTVTAEKKQPPLPAEKKSHTTMRFGQPGAGFPFSIQQTPLVDQEGFSIKGSFGLSGTITRPDKSKDLWVFAGQFELPSEEYKIGEVTYDIINAPIEYYTQKKSLPSSFVSQVMITIPVKLPPNAKDEKGDVKVPFRLEIPVSPKAKFLFTMIDKS